MELASRAALDTPLRGGECAPTKLCLLVEKLFGTPHHPVRVSPPFIRLSFRHCKRVAVPIFCHSCTHRFRREPLLVRHLHSPRERSTLAMHVAVACCSAAAGASHMGEQQQRSPWIRMLLYLVMAGAILFASFATPASATKNVTYSEFLDAVRDGPTAGGSHHQHGPGRNVKADGHWIKPRCGPAASIGKL